jgi:hypothetical protein
MDACKHFFAGSPPESVDPGTVLFNTLLHLFANGATGFNLFTNDGFVDGSLWLAVRSAVALVTPYEDLVMDGTPTQDSVIFGTTANAVVSGMTAGGGSGAILIASSTLPYGGTTAFSVGVPAINRPAGGVWTLCDLATTTFVAAGGWGCYLGQ